MLRTGTAPPRALPKKPMRETLEETLEEMTAKLYALDRELLVGTQTDRNLADLCDIVRILTAVVETQQRHIAILRMDLNEKDLNE